MVIEESKDDWNHLLSENPLFYKNYRTGSSNPPNARDIGFELFIG